MRPQWKSWSAMRKTALKQSAVSMATSWCLWCSLLVGVRCQTWEWKPHEFAATSLCANATHVCDPDRVLTEQQYRTLSEELISSEDNCERQLKVGVAFTQQTFLEQRHPNRDHTLDRIADDIRQEWRLSNCGNDLVIFFANGSREIGFSLGNSSREILGNAFEGLSQTLKKEWKTLEHEDYIAFTSTVVDRFRTLFKQRLSTDWTVAWNVLLTTGYLVVILAIVGIACYYCCYNREPKKSSAADTSVISSEMTTKYSKIEMSERSSHH